MTEPRTFARGRALTVLALLAFGAPAVPAQTAGTSEYQLKAVFLFNFTQFVEWPPEAFATPDAPVIVGVLGADPFGAALDAAVRDEHVGARKLVVQRYARVGDVGACHVLFISASEAGSLDQSLDVLQNRPILTVGDVEGFALRGVMIRFIPDKGRIRLRINLDAARSAGLQISSKLLRRAEIVGKKDLP